MVHFCLGATITFVARPARVAKLTEFLQNAMAPATEADALLIVYKHLRK